MFYPSFTNNMDVRSYYKKQPPVPSRHENVRHVHSHNCKRQGKSKTKRIVDESFQQQKKPQTNEILKYKVKAKFTKTTLQ